MWMMIKSLKNIWVGLIQRIIQALGYQTFSFINNFFRISPFGDFIEKLFFFFGVQEEWLKVTGEVVLDGRENIWTIRVSQDRIHFPKRKQNLCVGLLSWLPDLSYYRSSWFLNSHPQFSSSWYLLWIQDGMGPAGFLQFLLKGSRAQERPI